MISGPTTCLLCVLICWNIYWPHRWFSNNYFFVACCRRVFPLKDITKTHASVWIHALRSKSLHYSDSDSDGWSGVWGWPFRTRLVTGRLWDDHFRDLGHPPKSYRVQDAGFIGGSSIWWQLILISMKQTLKQNVFPLKWHLKTKQKTGMLATEVRSGGRQNPLFSMKIYNQLKKQIRKSTPDQP